MSSATQAFVTAMFTVAASGAVGYGFYRLIVPKVEATRPVHIARKWLAWMALFVSVTSLPPFFRLYSLEPLLSWAIVFVFFGGLAFGLGWVYAKLFKFEGAKSAGTPFVKMMRNDPETSQHEEDLYAAVAMELQRSDLRQGLWAKALSESEYDEQRAKAKYIKLRVNTLREERSLDVQEANRRDEEKARQEKESAEREKHLAFEHASEQLEWRAAGMVDAKRIRTRFRAVGFWFCFAAAALMAFVAEQDDEKYTNAVARGAIVMVVGLFAGVLGYLVAELARWFIPSQWRLQREETSIQTARDELSRVHHVFSWKEVAEGLLGLVIICGLIYGAVAYFKK